MSEIRGRVIFKKEGKKEMNMKKLRTLEKTVVHKASFGDFAVE